MVTLLRMMGHEVTAARNGPEALAAALVHPPEVLLLDIGLPSMDGFEVAKQLRRTAHGKDATIIALSGYSQEPDRRHGQEAGFDHYLVKPIDFDALRAFLAGTAVETQEKPTQPA